MKPYQIYLKWNKQGLMLELLRLQIRELLLLLQYVDEGS